MDFETKLAALTTFCGTIILKFLGGWDILIYTLILFMVLDFLTGLSVAYKKGTLSSTVGSTGAIKKVFILIIVGVGVGLDGVMNTENVIRSMVILWYLSFEGLSILENAALMGLPIPDKLKEKLNILKEA